MAPSERPKSRSKHMKCLFRGGFESPATIKIDSAGAQGWLVGNDGDDPGPADPGTPNPPPANWSELNHMFNSVAPNALKDGSSIVKFDTKFVHSGNRSLYMQQTTERNGNQNRLQVSGTDPDYKSRIYTVRWLYIPSSSLEIFTGNSQSNPLGGLREQRPHDDNLDFSMPIYSVFQNDRVFLNVSIVDYSHGSKWSTWTEPPYGGDFDFEDVDVPLDRWFKLRHYVKRHQTEGRIKVWFDDQLVADLHNVRTKNDSDTWFVKLADVDPVTSGDRDYPDDGWVQYVDDVEVWSGAEPYVPPDQPPPDPPDGVEPPPLLEAEVDLNLDVDLNLP